MNATKTHLLFGLALGMLATSAGTSMAQPDTRGGLLGLYVYETSRGLIINGFIRRTSAWDLHLDGEMEVGDTMVRLDGRRLRSVRDVFRITDGLRPGVDYVTLELKTPSGIPFEIDITPSGSGGTVTCQAAEDVRHRRPKSSTSRSGRPRRGRPRGR